MLLSHLSTSILACGLLSSTALAEAQSPDLASTVLTEVHETILTFLQPILESDDDVEADSLEGFELTPRHADEKERLLKRLSKSSGKWNNHHPRHRLLDALHGFTRYYARQNEEIERLRGLYKKVTKSQKKLLEHNLHYSSRFTDLQHHLSSNQALCDQIVSSGLEFYGIPRQELDEHIKAVEDKGGKADKTSVSQALKHVVRDWTTSGSRERDRTFSCLLGTLEELFPARTEDDADNAPRVLLPGAGLGRLGHDVAALSGFQVTTNEWSMYMNLLYRFLTSSPPISSIANSTTFHPFVDSFSHHLRFSSQTRPLSFPDSAIRPSSVLLTEGDFTSVFVDHADTYDVVLTYFFIDTARNLMSYLETIRRVLKPGGYWVNLGPLLYGTAPFVQLSLEEIVTVSEVLGFTFLDTEGGDCGEPTFEGKKTVRGMEAVYSFDDMQLTKSAYLAQFWVAQLSS
ncbi:hypothetical protein NLU13_5077 [Sarocladium strictum]|uniref:Carnosine N-methyltransferase n=1 Tax=Sarocladium strictum TaxID=5046 RepID=A0AA39L9I2_SARSR|nr:hypothetical protein NLU13_5077 [Sarocladium strictum]